MSRKELHELLFMCATGSGVVSGPTCAINLSFLFQRQLNFQLCIPKRPNKVINKKGNIDIIPGDYRLC